MKRRIAAALATSVLVAAVLPALPAGAAQGTDVIAASVPDGASTSDSGGYYELDAKPGDVITQLVRISNVNGHPVSASVEAVDGDTGPLTGSRLGPPGSPKAVTARWLSVSSPLITLNPGIGRDIPFTVRVPADAKPGQYLAGISASVPKDPAQKKKNQPGQGAFSLQLMFQRVIAVQVNVVGARAPKLVVTGAEASASGDGVTLGLHIANQGNAFAHGKGSVRVASTNTDVNFPINTFVSKTAIVFPVKWTPQVVPGTHNVQVDLQYEDGRRTSWNGDIVIAGDTQAALEQALSDLQVKPGGGLPWGLILAALLAAVFIAGAVTLRRRGRRPAVKYRHA